MAVGRYLGNYVDRSIQTPAQQRAQRRRNILRELATCRTEGVAIKNRGLVLSITGTLAEWTVDVHAWRDLTQLLLEQLSVTDANFFKTLNTFPRTSFQGVSPAHTLEYNMLVRRLEILEEAMRRQE
jgi:hypothetical protein